MSRSVGAADAIGRADRSLAAQIYDELRRRIIEGEIPAGTWLRERELAEEFSVSRIPLREALPQLEAEGFIVTHPRRGAVVRELTVRDATEYFDVKSSLEVLAARSAASRVRAGADTARLGGAWAAAQAAMAAGDDRAIAEANARVHDEIVELADNRLLASSLRPLHGLQRWFFGVTSDRDQTALAQEHAALVAAICDGDVEYAGSLAYAHIEKSRRESLPLLAERLPAG
ncbi:MULTISPECIES: GntR family transcriptional regulator [unclassified Microbacterium]|uniref:GntR family transcriptional regulator n=1 Tax=unclassified Microbacterium TaxID=2609290 RepID=UPI003016DEA1